MSLFKVIKSTNLNKKVDVITIHIFCIFDRFIFAPFALIVRGRILHWANSNVSNCFFFKHNYVLANLRRRLTISRQKRAKITQG